MANHSRDEYQFHRHLAESQRFVPRPKPVRKGIDWESVFAAAGWGFFIIASVYVWLTI
jgi:hypothetical protein